MAEEGWNGNKYTDPATGQQYLYQDSGWNKPTVNYPTGGFSNMIYGGGPFGGQLPQYSQMGGGPAGQDIFGRSLQPQQEVNLLGKVDPMKDSNWASQVASGRIKALGLNPNSVQGQTAAVPLTIPKAPPVAPLAQLAPLASTQGIRPAQGLRPSMNWGKFRGSPIAISGNVPRTNSYNNLGSAKG